MILVDTCTFIWDALQPGKLSLKAKKAVATAFLRRDLCLSEISLWEVAMLIKKRRIDVLQPYRTFIETALVARNYQLIGINPEIADLAVNLSDQVTFDPADRIIIATAQSLKIHLVTADKNIRKFADVKVIW